jgi:hypothetical protein
MPQSNCCPPRSTPDQDLLLAAAERVAAPRRSSCFVAYRGTSRLDAAPIVAVLYALAGSTNSKTGCVAQFIIAPQDVPPNTAVKNGADAAVCANCVHRPSSGGTCYVVPTFPILAPWYATRYLEDDLDAACRALRSSGRALRIGSWGDPTALPFDVIRALVGAARHGDRRRHTAYTQQWRTCDQRFREVAMASVISSQQRDQAKRLGWRTFRIRTAEMPVLDGEIICPATSEGGEKVTCARCLLCNGASAAKDIVVVAHGSRNKVRRLEQLVRLRAAELELDEGAPLGEAS